MKTFVEIATEIGELVTQKNAAYGSSFAKAGEFLALLYPAGLKPEQYCDALLLVRIFDKQMRIATNRDALGEDPFADIGGYGVCGVYSHQQKEGRGECLENASGGNAWSRSKEQRDSARPGAAPQTLPSDGAGIESGASPQHSSCCARPTSAPVASATGDASANGADLDPIKIGEIEIQILMFLEHVYPEGRAYNEINIGSPFASGRLSRLSLQGFLTEITQRFIIVWRITGAGRAFLLNRARYGDAQ